ncbi:aldehyde dehydrogenase [Salinimicrobium sediminilitoris]|uniref:aldehyde dehydrogenase n=1 Tax=Salinimicrobium sediminilitoris TaxID=2876715 RepID=UPI001E2FB44F|nr:aldehyde dehydrogenase [Salinimicrobium sediminilitoris]MCC8358824.1 aldehyde dehydrogenase [Salinimicrobium sediminilitoris]
MAEEIKTAAEVDIPKLLSSQKAFFEAGHTLDVSERIDKLKALKELIESKEKEIAAALFADFRKPEFETYATETALILSELKFTIKKLGKWAKPKKVKSTFLNFPSTDYIYSQPYGNVLVLAPWNYPFQLSVSPAIGALAAGNTVVIKPSEYAPATSQLTKEIFAEVFPEEQATVVLGGVETSEELLQQKWDYVFFTGSVPVGRIVAKAIAPNLTPATLELGGKNPCIIHKSAKIELAAKRIVWGKFINAGQTCISPDYILIDKKKKTEFTEVVKKEIKAAFGEDIKKSPDYARIINKKNFERLQAMLEGQTFITGGETSPEDNYMAPTLLNEPSLDSEVMQDEIFGPILPILTFSDETEIEKIINHYPDPLALYVFAEDKDYSEEILKKYRFGGGASNDVVVHIANKNLPFGGVGSSGYGGYHGKFSFDTFTHKKSISKRGTWIDIPLRYAPYAGKLPLIKKVMKRI